MTLTSHPVPRLRGVLRAPGDKSCSHRALMFGGLANGRTEVTGLLEGDDVRRTGAVMAALGAEVRQTGPGAWMVEGRGAAALSSPIKPLDFGNSGTGVRLMMGLLAGLDIEAELIGDASLSARPMGRVMTPLRDMGARFEDGGDGRLPLQMVGNRALKGVNYTPPHASAQVKSAVLLAGLNAQGITRVSEPRKTRDHTERMLTHFGAALDYGSKVPGGPHIVSLEGGQALSGQRVIVPGDPSSAAFLAAAAIVSLDGDVLVERVMSNPTRDGVYEAISSMGAAIGAEEVETEGATSERLIDMQFSSSALKGRAVPERLVPSMIDEFPILAVMAAFAEGETIVSGADELRVKESDRIAAIVSMLRVNGVEVEERADGFTVRGCGGPPPGGGLVETRHDHRIAMSALVMGTASQAPVSIDDAGMIATSYPDFMAHMTSLGADIRP